MNDMDYCQTVLDLTQTIDHFITLAKDDEDQKVIDSTLAGAACIILEELSEDTLDCVLENFKEFKREATRNMKAWEDEMAKYTLGGEDNDEQDQKN